MRGADVVLLVTEPTPFGLYDLTLAVAAVRQLGLPIGVVVNRVGIGNREVFDFCLAQAIPVLLELPDDRRVAEAYARGELASPPRARLRTADGMWLVVHASSLAGLGDRAGEVVVTIEEARPPRSRPRRSRRPGSSPPSKA